MLFSKPHELMFDAEVKVWHCTHSSSHFFFTSAGKNLKYVTMTLYCSSSQDRIKSVGKALHASVWLCQLLDISFTRTVYVVLFVFQVFYASNFLQTLVSSYTRGQIRNASCFWSHPTVDRDWRDNRVPSSFHT